MMTRENTVIIECLKSLLGSGDPKRLSDRIMSGSLDWPAIIKSSRDHHIDGFVAFVLINSELFKNFPVAIQQLFQDSLQSASFNGAQKKLELRKIASLLGTQGVPFIALKGAALMHTVYEQMPFRSMNDLDILIKPKDKDLVVSLLKQQGFKAKVGALKNRWHQQIWESEEELYWQRCGRHTYRNAAGVELDIHLEPLYLVNKKTVGLNWPQVWQESIQLKAISPICYIMSPSHQLLFTAMHAIDRYSPQLSQILDIALLIKQNPGLIAAIEGAGVFGLSPEDKAYVLDFCRKIEDDATWCLFLERKRRRGVAKESPFVLYAQIKSPRSKALYLLGLFLPDPVYYKNEHCLFRYLTHWAGLFKMLTDFMALRVMSVGSKETIVNTRSFISLLKMAKVKMPLLGLSALLYLGFSLFAMYAVCLLFPLSHGIIEGDFTLVRNLNGLRGVVNLFPEFFNSSTRLFFLLIFWIYGITLIKNFCQYLGSLIAQTQARLATIQLRQMLIEKALSFGKKFYDTHSTAYVQQVLFKSSSLVEAQFALLQRFITQSLLLVVYVAVMLMISWKLTLIAALAFPLTHWMTRRIIERIRGFSKEQDNWAKKLNDFIANMLHGMPLIKGFAKERQEMNRFSTLSTGQINESVKVQRMMSLIAPVDDLGNMTGILCLAIGLVLLMQVEPLANPSQVFVLFYLTIRLIPGLNAFNNFKIGSAVVAASLRDIEYLLTQDASMVVQGGAVEFTGFKSGIEFKDLSFRYANDQPLVLDGLSFSIKKGEVVAIVGPSGSGKTTLVNLLMRFYDCPKGSILIDGRDIREYSLETLKNYLAFVGQDALLFNDTLRHNIIYGASTPISDADLNKWGEKLYLNDFVNRLPDRYETLVGEKGARLSGGERQRVAIARALIKDPDILIMDEATSALDSAMEAKINDVILGIRGEKTVIMIAHRLSTIKGADKIIYLDHGRIQEFGSLQELIKTQGRFYTQWMAQQL